MLPFQPAKNYAQVLRDYRSRGGYIENYGFAVVSLETVTVLSRFLADKRCIEVGSGTGYLSAELKRQGVNIKAADICEVGAEDSVFRKTHALDIIGDATAELPGDYDVVVMSWPPFWSSFGHDVVSLLKPGQILVYEGEGKGGCTGTDPMFHDLANKDAWLFNKAVSDDLNAQHVQFFGIHDEWHVYTRL